MLKWGSSKLGEVHFIKTEIILLLAGTKLWNPTPRDGTKWKQIKSLDHLIHAKTINS